MKFRYDETGYYAARSTLNHPPAFSRHMGLLHTAIGAQHGKGNRGGRRTARAMAPGGFMRTTYICISWALVVVLLVTR